MQTRQAGGLEAGCSSVWRRRGILGQPFPKLTKWPFVCCSGPWLTGLQHAIMLCSCLSLGLPNPEESGGGEARTGVGGSGGGGVLKERQEREKKGRMRKKDEKEEEECRRGEEREKGCGLSPGCSPSHPPFPPLHLPLLPNPSLAASLYTMAASLLKFHVIGSRAWSFVLPQCPGSGACCRGDTLCKLKAGKPFLLSLASEKGRKSPPHQPTPFFPSPPFLPISPLYQNRREAVKLGQAPLEHFGL